MNETWPSKDPDEVLDYSWPVPLDDGDTITGTPVATVIAGTVTLGTPAVDEALVTVVISGGAPSENAIVKMVAVTAGGRTFVEEFLLRINAAATVPTDADALTADIATLQAAQMKLASGQMVTEVWRSGRRLIYGRVTIESLQTLIEMKQRLLDQAQAVAQGKKRRRAITLGWPA